MSKPIGTIPQLADYLLNGFWKWTDEIPHHWAVTTLSYNINALTSAEQFLAQSALNAWQDVTGLVFKQTTGAASITFNDNGRITAYETDSFNSSGVMSSATVDISSDWITTDGGAYDGRTGIDSYGYQTYLHEIGHALGLGHQGPYNGSANYSTDALYADDTWQYSVMSYFSQSNFDGGSYRYVVTPQIADIYAVEQLYGISRTAPTGRTTYGFHDTAGPIFDFAAYDQAPALTISGTGGTERLDCSGYSAAQTIDLHPGAFSSVGGLVNNIGIALDTTIETAIGGTGNDKLIANDEGCWLFGHAGADTLIGGGHNDVLIGGPGADVLNGGAGIDRAQYSDSARGLTVDLRTPANNTGIAQGDTYTSIENLFGSNHNDSLRGNGGSNRIWGGNGNDHIFGRNGNDHLIGNGGSDHLYGGNGNDHLVGGVGNDVLIGGNGNDMLVGGPGDDTFVFDTALNALSNLDDITDFAPGADTIALDHAIFDALGMGTLAAADFTVGTHATTADQHIIYDSTTGALSYDADGNGSGAAVEFATVHSGLSLTHADFKIV